MRTTGSLLIAAILYSSAATFRCLAEEIPVTPNLPKTIVVDFSKAGGTENILIKLSDGREITISRGGEDRIALGARQPRESSRAQEFIIYPAASNWIYLSTKITQSTLGDLKRQDEENRATPQKAEKKQ